MNTGMLWLCSKEKSLSVNITQAVSYYEKKYERKPELCLVNPGMVDPAAPIEITGLTVRAYRPVLPGHIWIGYEDMPNSRKEETPT